MPSNGIRRFFTGGFPFGRSGRSGLIDGRATMPPAIGLGLALIHLVGIPVTNSSVNPARITGPALFVGGCAIAQLWLFWLAPVVGGVRTPG
jgi:glycerol uptake facilitator-like aquaporin